MKLQNNIKPDQLAPKNQKGYLGGRPGHQAK